MSKRTHFISGAKFCRPCGLGFSAEKSLSTDQAQTLGLFISECLASIFVPQFLRLGKVLGIANSNIPSLADLGCLVHAEASVEYGTRILYCLPPWLEAFQQGVRLSFSVKYAVGSRAFVDSEAPEAPWLRKFSINELSFKQEIETALRLPLVYNSSWMNVDGVEKLRGIMAESRYADHNIISTYNEDLKLLKKLLLIAENYQNVTYNMLDVNDGSIVLNIGARKLNPFN